MAASEEAPNLRAEACRRAADLRQLESERCAELEAEIKFAEANERTYLRAIRAAGATNEVRRQAFARAQVHRRLRDALQEELYARRRIEELHDRQFQICAGIIREGI